MKLEHSLTPYTKINSKWIKGLNVRPGTIKLIEENTGRTLYDINHSKILSDPPPREMEINKNKNRGFPGGTVVENLPVNAGDTGSSPGLGGSHMPRSN